MERKFRRNRSSRGRYHLGSGYRDVVVQLEGPSKTAKLSTLLAQWAQVATLAVLVFGYFYTVRPVFQKDRLSEEVAQLQIQRVQSTKRLADLRKHEAQIRTTLAGLQSQNQALQHDNIALRNDQQEATTAALTADRKRKEATTKLSIAQDKLRDVDIQYSEAAGHIFRENLQMAINYSIIRSMFFFSSDYSKPQIVKKLSDAVPDISKLVIGSLDDLSVKQGQSAVNPLWATDTFQRIVKNFRERFDARRSNIIIAKVDPKVWANAYLSQLRSSHGAGSVCVDKYWEGLAKHEKWSVHELATVRSSKDYAQKQSAIFERYCSVMAEYTITKTFNDAWSKYYREVTTRLESIPNDIIHNKSMQPFPQKLLVPPEAGSAWIPREEDIQFGH